MKIVNNILIEKLFGELNLGDVFMNCGKYYMKTEEIEAPQMYFINAINLKTGAHAWFDKKEKIISMDCELTIK